MTHSLEKIMEHMNGELWMDKVKQYDRAVVQELNELSRKFKVVYNKL